MHYYAPKGQAMLGERFGHLVVVGDAGVNRHRQPLWKVKCDCGNEKDTNASNLRNGYIQTCGCSRLGPRLTSLSSKRAAPRAVDLRDPSIGWAMKSIRAMKQRAKRFHFEFDLEINDLLPLPTHCPLLGIELRSGNRGFNAASPAVDRIDNSKGYVRGNVWVISNRANVLKRDSTLEELEMIVAGLRKRQGLNLTEERSRRMMASLLNNTLKGR